MNMASEDHVPEGVDDWNNSDDVESPKQCTASMLIANHITSSSKQVRRKSILFLSHTHTHSHTHSHTHTSPEHRCSKDALLSCLEHATSQVAKTGVSQL